MKTTLPMRVSLAFTLLATFPASRLAADTVIDADCFTFPQDIVDTNAFANDFHLSIQGHFIGDPSSSVFPNRTVNNQTETNNMGQPVLTGTADFSGNTLLNGSSHCVKFKATADHPGPSGYFTKDGSTISSDIKSKALDGTEVVWVPQSGAYFASLSLSNAFGSPLTGSIEVLVNSGFHGHFSLDEYDVPRNANLVFSRPAVTLLPGEAFATINAFLPSDDYYLLIRGTADAGDGTGSSAFAIALSPASEVQPVTVLPGVTAIANNFQNGDNSLNAVLPLVADGTLLFKFNSGAQLYDTYQFQTGFGWMPPGGTLAPGEGAFLQSTSAQVFVFTGTAVPATPVPRLPAGRYLVSSPVPSPASFEQLMGFPPVIGDQVYKYDTTVPSTNSPPTSMHTYWPTGWDNVPIVGPGKAAFVQLVPTPAVTLPLVSSNLLGAFNPPSDALFNTDAGTYQIGISVFTGGRLATVNQAHQPATVRVFDFTSISIPQGVTVRAIGGLPLILLGLGSASINGTIDVSGHAGGSAGQFGGPAGGSGGGALAIFTDVINIGPTAQILARGGDAGISSLSGNCIAGGIGAPAGLGGGKGGDGGASQAGGRGGMGGDAASQKDPVTHNDIYLGCGGGGGGGGAYSGGGGFIGIGLSSGDMGSRGGKGACSATVAGGDGGAGGGIFVNGAKGIGGNPPGGAGTSGGAGWANTGGGGGGGGATLGGDGGAGGAGAGFSGGGGGGGGGDTCPDSGISKGLGGSGGGGGGGADDGQEAAPGAVVYGALPIKEGGGGGGGCIELGGRLGGVFNSGLLSARGGQGGSQHGGEGSVVVLGRLQNAGQIEGLVRESYGQDTSQWYFGGGGGGGGAGGSGQTSIDLHITLNVGIVTVSWDGGGTLETTDRLGGIWNQLPGMNSPFMIQPTETTRFFRVVTPCPGIAASVIER